MVGKIIRQERIRQKIKSKDLAAAAGVDTGHLSHIEKGIRNPSKSILAKICKELNLSYQFMLNISQNAVEETSDAYDISNYVPYNKILYAEDIKLINCPEEIKGASLVTKMKDDSMAPVIEKDALIYVHYTSVISPDDICLVILNGEQLVRKISIKGDSYILIPLNKQFKNITIGSDKDNFNIVGKIIL